MPGSDGLTAANLFVEGFTPHSQHQYIAQKVYQDEAIWSLKTSIRPFVEAWQMEDGETEM